MQAVAKQMREQAEGTPAEYIFEAADGERPVEVSSEGRMILFLATCDTSCAGNLTAPFIHAYAWAIFALRATRSLPLSPGTLLGLNHHSRQLLFSPTKHSRCCQVQQRHEGRSRVARVPRSPRRVERGRQPPAGQGCRRHHCGAWEASLQRTDPLWRPQQEIASPPGCATLPSHPHCLGGPLTRLRDRFADELCLYRPPHLPPQTYSKLTATKAKELAQEASEVPIVQQARFPPSAPTAQAARQPARHCSTMRPLSLL